MRFDIMTLFPEMTDRILGESIMGRAQNSGAIEVFSHNIRDFSEDKHRRVDDTPYGGSPYLPLLEKHYGYYIGKKKKNGIYVPAGTGAYPEDRGGIS